MNIPNFVDMQVIDKDGFFTPEWKIIMQNLIQTLQQNASDEGLVAPTQNAANIGIIEANQIPSPTGNLYTCQFGTLLYDSTANSIRACISNLGVPQFKTVVLI